MALVSLAMGVSAIGYASGDVFPAIGRPSVLAKVLVPIVAVRVTALLIAAPYGLVAVAAAHLAVSVLNAFVRLLLIRGFIGIPVTKAVAATAPGLLAFAGVVLAAGSCLLLMEPGVTRLVVCVLAGMAGAFVAVRLGARDVLPEVSSLLRSIVRKEEVTT
jgi:PST family polysaccharide transporter